MNIAIIDVDLIERKRHRFPNLACMKISGYYKDLGHSIELLLNYNNLESYDKVFISKVFTDTPIDENILKLPNVTYGGTGFYYDKAPRLACEIEHHMPDYHLYDNFINEKISKGVKRSEFEYYLDYSIGFTTRGCFRQCPFCVNKNYKKVEAHSSLKEFYDSTRKYICLLDDNILGYPQWKDVLLELQMTGKYFQFKQGMDERILTEEKCEILSNSKYKGDFIFAFDNIEDRDIIENKMRLWRSHVSKSTKLYCFCGFDRNDNWDEDFWEQDIVDLLERIQILMKHKCLPYIMRFNRYEESPYRGIYITLARWCNQPSLFKKKSFREFCESNGDNSSSMRYLKEYELNHKDVSNKYFDLKHEDAK